MKEKIDTLVQWIDNRSDYIVWFIGVGSVFGSLYYSEIEKLIPCDLCWWQRIFMYPIALIMTVAILRKDRSVYWYVMPLSILGFFVAFYHTLLQWGIVSENLLDCSARSAVSCANAEIDYLGFITIPFLAFLGFTAINLLIALRWYRRQLKRA